MNNLKAYLVYKGLISARWFDLVSSMEEKSNPLWRSFFFYGPYCSLGLATEIYAGSDVVQMQPKKTRVKSFNFYIHNKCFPSLEHTQELGRSYYCDRYYYPCWGLDLLGAGPVSNKPLALNWFLPWF